jgi:SAM-dependent methyltransferase
MMKLLKKIKFIFARVKNLWIEKLLFLEKSIPEKGKVGRKKYSDLDSMIESHFAMHSEKNHPCRRTISLALNMLDNKPATILETCSSAWGTNSSLLFDDYVNSFGGQFFSVDIRAEPMYSLVKKTTSRSRFYRDDSVHFLRNFVPNANKFDLVYLDSWDVVWEDPLPSAIHGLNEFLNILPVLQKNGGLLLIDDSPRDGFILEEVSNKPRELFERFFESYGFYPGKGGLVKFYLEKNKIGKGVAHEYQLLWQF